MPDGWATDGMRGVLRVVRRPRGEAQWTQLIAAAAQSDGEFAPRLAATLLAASADPAAVASMGTPPNAVRCEAEISLTSEQGVDLGRVDLIFRDPQQEFCLLVELKLGSDYGDRQLERYIEALDAVDARRRGLLAITATTPQIGEDAVANDPRWLGSLRWARLYEPLYELPHADPAVATAWRAALELLREQGDFGPMDFDPTAIHAWARRDEAEALIRYLLGEVAQPALQTLQEHLRGVGGAALVYRGQSSVIWPWRNQLHLKFRVPAEIEEERLRIQFHAGAGQPYFSVEGRYEHPKEDVSTDEDVISAEAKLQGHGFNHGNDGWGYYWARVVGVDEILAGAETIDRMMDVVTGAIHELASSGLFGALAARNPTTAESAPPDTETEAAV